MLICVRLSVPSTTLRYVSSATRGQAELVSPNQIPGGTNGCNQHLSASIRRPPAVQARFDPNLHIS